MGAVDQTDAAALINATTGAVAYTAVTGTKVRLGATAPTAASNMTELSATGYTPGGSTITFNSATTNSSGATATGGTSVVSWTNSGGTSWTGIVGGEVWDIAGTPKRHWFGNWTGQPIVVAAGNTFAIAAGAVILSIP
jgi:hypothetical protein